MLVLDGKIASAAVKARLLEQTTALKAAGKRTPHLAAILVGNNGASETYVASKVKNCVLDHKKNENTIFIVKLF